MRQPRVMIVALLLGGSMAAFQLVRPWGDTTLESGAMARAFADPRWLIAHAAGAVSFVALAWLAAELRRVRRGTSTRIPWLASALGAVLVLPYFGAETFALHEIGSAALAGAPVDVAALADGIRMNLLAVSVFGIGLILVAVGAVALAIAAAGRGVAAWGAWPLGIAVACALPQFALPPVGRMTYGVLVLAASIAFVVACGRSARTVGDVVAVR